MTRCIGFEYLIGNAFIYLTTERFISLKVINNYSYNIQQYWNSNNSDAILYGTLEQAFYDYSDYFSFDRDSGLVTLNSDITTEMLTEIFVWRLPEDIAKDFETVSYKILS